MSHTFASVVCFSLLVGNVCCAEVQSGTGTTVVPDSQDTYAPSESNLTARRWFQDAKFGIFVHWGLYSELGGVGTSGLPEWIMNDLKIPAAKYERLAQFFNPVQFDADAWVSAFKKAGARYLIITTKHHDGFAMFHSRVSPYNIVDATPFKRDPIRELADACRKHGIKLFFYYSQLDWHSPDYFPRGATGHFTGRAESGSWEAYLDYQDRQLAELFTNYGAIGGVWLDGWWDQEHTALRDQWLLARTYHSLHSLQPSALIINNHHQAPYPGEDVQTFEQDLPGQNTKGFNRAGIGALPIEMAETMNQSWGFSLTDDKFKSPETLVRTLVNAAGRGATLVLNTGPMPNGRLQPESLHILDEIGAWLNVYGRSVYGTRAGPVPPRPWGVTTQSEGVVYVHVLDWADDRLFIPIVQPIRRATSLVDGAPITMRKVKGGVELDLKPRQSNEWDRVVALELGSEH
jgi:alpha-L-fucosidase